MHADVSARREREEKKKKKKERKKEREKKEIDSSEESDEEFHGRKHATFMSAEIKERLITGMNTIDLIIGTDIENTRRRDER